MAVNPQKAHVRKDRKLALWIAFVPHRRGIGKAAYFTDQDVAFVWACEQVKAQAQAREAWLKTQRQMVEEQKREDTLMPLGEVFQHLNEWDKRHHPSGRLKLWPQVRDWWRDHPYHLLAALVIVAALILVGIVKVWPDRPDSMLPADVYTPFTQVPRPSRPPHPIDVYIPPGYEGK